MDESGAPIAHRIEEVGHGHTRRVAPLIQLALGEAGRTIRDLAWIAADLGPGSFTGVRVGLATAEALALASGARLTGAPSLTALAAGALAQRALVVPLVPAGRRDVYSGYFRADAGGLVTLLAAPQVGTAGAVLELTREALGALRETSVRFVGPGAARERAALEDAFPGSTAPPWRWGGLSALDLAAATWRDERGANGKSPAAERDSRARSLEPVYVRPAQAEGVVRRRALAAHAPILRAFTPADVDAAIAIERRVFGDPWSAEFFRGELGHALSHARVAEVDGQVAGYSMAWLGAGAGHLGNLAVAPEQRRRGVARALLEDVLERARAEGVESIELEVRGSNFAAQWLYQAHGFRLAGLRRRYYRDNGEDALIMQWRADA